MLTLYTNSEGKAFIRDGALVAGDCCCEDGPCGLPHLIIQLGNAHATGSGISAGDTITLIMRYFPDANDLSTYIETSQTIQKTESGWSDWQVGGPGESQVSCADGRTTKTNRLHWGEQNDIDVYPPMNASIGAPGRILFTISWTGSLVSVGATMDATIARSFRCKVLDQTTKTDNLPTERTSQTNSTFQVAFDNEHDYILDIVRK